MILATKSNRRSLDWSVFSSSFSILAPVLADSTDWWIFQRVWSLATYLSTVVLDLSCTEFDLWHLYCTTKQFLSHTSSILIDLRLSLNSTVSKLLEEFWARPADYSDIFSLQCCVQIFFSTDVPRQTNWSTRNLDICIWRRFLLFFLYRIRCEKIVIHLFHKNTKLTLTALVCWGFEGNSRQKRANLLESRLHGSTL